MKQSVGGMLALLYCIVIYFTVGTRLVYSGAQGTGVQCRYVQVCSTGVQYRRTVLTYSTGGQFSSTLCSSKGKITWLLAEL